jgi:hypothetical protein
MGHAGVSARGCRFFGNPIQGIPVSTRGVSQISMDWIKIILIFLLTAGWQYLYSARGLAGGYDRRN